MASRNVESRLRQAETQEECEKSTKSKDKASPQTHARSKKVRKGAGMQQENNNTRSSLKGLSTLVEVDGTLV